MLVEETTTQASLEMLARVRLGRLASTQALQPYVVPFYFAYHQNYLYSFSTVGQKIEWMRANPLVCVEADEVVSARQWMSIIVFGRYEELPDRPEWRSEREFAWRLLQQYAMWWEPVHVKTLVHGAERVLAPVFYRIYVAQVTGRRATLEPVVPTETRPSITDASEGRRLKKILRRVQRKLGR